MFTQTGIERDPELVEMARQLGAARNARDERALSLRGIAAKLENAGCIMSTGERYSAAAVATMLGWGWDRYKTA